MKLEYTSIPPWAIYVTPQRPLDATRWTPSALITLPFDVFLVILRAHTRPPNGPPPSRRKLDRQISFSRWTLLFARCWKVMLGYPSLPSSLVSAYPNAAEEISRAEEQNPLFS